MSSETVRAAVVARIAEANLGHPLYATADERAGATEFPEIWLTPVYTVDRREPLSMGSRPYFEEIGSVTIVAFGRSGQQGTPARNAVNSLKTWFDGYNPSVALSFTSVTGPVEPDPAAEGEFYPVQLVVSYTLQERQP
jgi:hypothetical protein